MLLSKVVVLAVGLGKRGYDVSGLMDRLCCGDGGKWACIGSMRFGLHGLDMMAGSFDGVVMLKNGRYSR